MTAGSKASEARPAGPRCLTFLPPELHCKKPAGGDSPELERKGLGGRVSLLAHSVLFQCRALRCWASQVEELRTRLEEKNRHIEKKTSAALQATQDRNRMNNELTELRDHMDIKDRKINVLQRKVPHSKQGHDYFDCIG